MALGWSLLLATLLVGCAPGLKNPTTCQMGSIPVEVEEGALTLPAGMTTCEYATGMLSHYRGLFEDRFGHAALEEEHWTVRIRASETVQGDGATGVTYELDRTIDLAGWANGNDPWLVFPHELRHVQLGSAAGHTGWCLDMLPWEEATIGLDESKYLNCDDGQHMAHPGAP